MDITLQIVLSKDLMNEAEWTNHQMSAKQQRISIEKELIESGVISKDELYSSICAELGYEFIKAHFGVKLNDSMASKFKPRDMSSDRFIPVIIKDTTYIVVDNPESTNRDTRIVQILGDSPNWALCTTEVMDTLQNKLVVPLEMEEMSDDADIASADNNSEVQDLVRTGQKIPDMLAMIVQSAVVARASDIQILPADKSIEIYFKIDGVKSHFMSLDKNVHEQLVRVIMNNAKMSGQKVFAPAVGKAQFKVNGVDISLRVNMLSTPRGTDVNMRVLDNSVYPLEDLGLTPKVLEQYRQLFNMTKGLVLVTGPTGSGKSTTLYSGLLDSDVSKRTIMSVEDPIEYVVPGITQVEINDKEGNTFIAVTKGFLRHNPNVIIVGEIRDYEVANEAFKAAATGHLVFSTLHTNDAVSAISRILNLELPGYTIAESLCAVVAQRLIRKVCTHCSYDYTVSEEDADMIAAGLEVGTVIKKSKGCDHCRDSGYYGRVAINEMLIIDTRIREMLEEPNVAPTTIRKYVRQDLKVPTLAEDALLKVRNGQTTFDEIAHMFHEIV